MAYDNLGRTIQSKKLREKNVETFDAANVVNEGKISDDVESILTVSFDCSSDEWILNLSCIYYICFNKSWFDIYKVVNDIILS